MSSKLVKKSLDFVASTNENIQKKKHKNNKSKRKARQQSLPYKIQAKKGKTFDKIDYTEQNLQYFKRATWTMKQDTYEKIVQNQDKHLKRMEDSESKNEDLDD